MIEAWRVEQGAFSQKIYLSVLEIIVAQPYLHSDERAMRLL